MGYPTYKELLADVLIRMGEEGNVEGTDISETAVVKAYKKAVPALLRQGLAILGTAGKFVVKSVEISRFPGDGEDRADLRELAPDFFNLLYREVYYKDARGGPRRRADNYRLEGERWFVMEPGAYGVWTVYYNAYPRLPEGPVPDGAEIAADPEVCALLPLFIEGKLRMIHDEDYGTAVLNEFEQRRAELMAETATRAPGAYVTGGEGMGKWL